MPNDVVFLIVLTPPRKVAPSSQSVAEGELTDERFQSYLKLVKESKYYEMTYLEKRKKDKTFGKMVKNYTKFKQKQ